MRTHNYNTWWLTDWWKYPTVAERDAALGLAASILPKYGNVQMSEHYSGLVPEDDLIAQIRQANAGAKVYRLYDLMCKPNWDTDWKNSSDTSRMQTPITRLEIDANDWWLRDGSGEIVKESERIWLLDVGKPGYKEAFLRAVLARADGKGFDGILFDYLSFVIDKWTRNVARPVAYPTDAEWFESAWKPFFQYVVAGLHAAGYRVIGNCAGEYISGYASPTVTAWADWQRSVLDGSVYEQGAVGWTGEWLPAATIERRMRAIHDDPLEVWASDGGLTSGITDFDVKRLVSMAMYLLAVPGKDSLRVLRSYNYAGDKSAHWDPLFDLDIGQPVGSARKRADGSAFWVRYYDGGMVLLNYSGIPTTYTFRAGWVDPDGREYHGKTAIAGHEGLILKRV